MSIEEEIKFAEKDLWKHKDGKEQLLVTMGNKQLLSIREECKKRLIDKNNSVCLFTQKLDSINTILTTRNIKLPKDNWNKVFENKINTTLEEACNVILNNITEENRHLVDKLYQQIHLKFKKQLV
jgi:hypothetical protein